MILSRHSASPEMPRRAGAAPTAPARGNIEDRTWYASSRELAEGLVVQEIDEAPPMEPPPVN